jgi:hypothetical protein
MRRTVRKLFVAFGIPFIFLGFSVSAALSQAHQQIRLAIVDTGAGDKLPPSFLDLLLVSFTRYPGIALLERTEVDRILTEQALSLSFSGTDALQAGRIQATDAFLMLESAKSDKSTFIRVRLVDTRYGLKLWDALIPFSAEPKSIEQAKKLAESVAGKLSNFNVTPENLVPLGVSAIRSEELTAKWDWLSDTLAAGIEQNLALYPGVILMERFRTRTLREERNLTEGLPEALRPSAVSIDGSFKIGRQNGQESISLYLRCRKQKAVLFETRIEDSVENVGNLYKKAVDAIMAGIGKNQSAAPMNPSNEAAMLASEAQAYLTLKDPERALSMAEAAVALRPDFYAFKILLVQSVNEFLAYQIRKFNLSRRDSPQKEMVDIILETSLRSFPTLDAVASGIPAKATNDTPFDSIHNFIANLIHWANNAPRIYPHLDDRQREAMRELSRSFWQLYGRCSQIYMSNDPRLYDRYYVRYLSYMVKESSRALVLCESANDAVDHSRDLVFNQKFYDLTGLIDCFVPPTYAEWPKGTGSAAIIRQYLEELAGNDNPEIRIYSESANLYFYSDYLRNYGEAVRHLDNFVDLLKRNSFLIKKRDISSPINLIDSVDFANPITVRRFSSNLQEDAAIKYDHLLDLVEYSFRNEFPKIGSGQLDTNLAFSIRYLVERDVAGNRAEKAMSLLQRGLDGIQSGWAKRQLELFEKELKASKPGLWAAKDTSQSFNFQGQQIYTVKGPQTRRIFLHRLVVGDKGGAIVYSDSKQIGIGPAHYGVISLSGETWKPAATQALPYDIRFERKAADFLWERDYTRKGPAIALDDSNVYVGFYQGGIIIHSKDGGNRILNESSGLATDYIRSLELLDGKLYALVGAQPGESGLMEVDPVSGVSKILFSSKTKNPEQEPDGRPICGIAADPEQHALWILSVDKNERYVFSLYYPESQRVVRNQTISVKEGFQVRGYSKEYSALSKINDHLIIEGVPDALQIDLKTDNAFLLFSMTGGGNRISRWNYIYRMTANNLQRFIPVNSDLVGITDSDLMFFRNGDREPKLLGADFLEGHSRKISLKDIALTPKGLLVLTEDSLYLIPAIVERTKTAPVFTPK